MVGMIGLWKPNTTELDKRKRQTVSIGDQVYVTWVPNIVAVVTGLPCDLGLYEVQFGHEETAQVFLDDITLVDGARFEAGE